MSGASLLHRFLVLSVVVRYFEPALRREISSFFSVSNFLFPSATRPRCPNPTLCWRVTRPCRRPLISSPPPSCGLRSIQPVRPPSLPPLTVHFPPPALGAPGLSICTAVDAFASGVVCFASATPTRLIMRHCFWHAPVSSATSPFQGMYSVFTRICRVDHARLALYPLVACGFAACSNSTMYRLLHFTSQDRPPQVPGAVGAEVAVDQFWRQDTAANGHVCDGGSAYRLGAHCSRGTL